MQPQQQPEEDREAAENQTPKDRNSSAYEYSVKTRDMNDAEYEFAISTALELIEQVKTEIDLARLIKVAMEEKFGLKWHCIVGRHFASHVSYEPGHYLYVKIGREVILLFKSGGDQI